MCDTNTSDTTHDTVTCRRSDTDVRFMAAFHSHEIDSAAVKTFILTQKYNLNLQVLSLSRVKIIGKQNIMINLIHQSFYTK